MSNELNRRFLELARNELSAMTHTEKRKIIWELLVSEIAGKDESITWLLYQVQGLIEDEGDRVVAPFQ